MKADRKLRSEAARLAVDSFCPGDESSASDAARLLAMAIMWENYLNLGADETQAIMKIMPEESATILKLVSRDD